MRPANILEKMETFKLVSIINQFNILRQNFSTVFLLVKCTEYPIVS